ncbi:MAG: response regulator transcription factor [Thiobacillus sp.]|nr:response regulator transcription factor [Thiobacillus sp.]
MFTRPNWTAMRMTDKITILIADDHMLVREGMRMLLGRERDFDLVGEASDGSEALRLACRLRPRVVILDLGLPVMDGIEVARQLRTLAPESRLLALSARMDSASVRTALDQGMAGYVPKSENSSELIEAIRTLACGQRYISPAVAPLLDTSPPDTSLALTPREREILRCVAEGLTSKDIAARLGISAATVQKHRENLGRKLGTRNVAEMTAYALKHTSL